MHRRQEGCQTGGEGDVARAEGEQAVCRRGAPAAGTAGLLRDDGEMLVVVVMGGGRLATFVDWRVMGDLEVTHRSVDHRTVALRDLAWQAKSAGRLPAASRQAAAASCRPPGRAAGRAPAGPRQGLPYNAAPDST